MIHPKCLFSNLLNKMKKPSVKDLFAVWGVILFVSAGIWIVAQSNANDEAPIMIDTNKYTATQHIQEVHLNDTSSSKKIWLKNQDGLVLGVGSVGVDERVGKLKNDAGGASAVIAGSGNGNWWSESSLIVGGENNQLANGKIGSVVMGGKANQVDSSETVVLASKDSATHGTGAVVVAVDRGEVFGENSLSFAGDAIVRRNDSMVIGSAVMMNGEWSFVFNGREQQRIDVNTDNSFIVGANNGLIIGTNKNNGSGIGLTVNGAVKVGEARGNDNMQTGAIFRVACSSPAGASCLCANISGQVKSISSNPACNNVCAGKSKQCFLDAKCGTRAITYAAAETTRRANTDFCTVGSHVQGADPRFPNVGEVSWTCVSDFGGASANCSAKKKPLPKEDAECGSYHGMNFMAASLTNWPAGWTFCEKGVPTPTVPAFPKTGKPVSWTCGGENLNTVPCSANGCNRCSKEGFPYCFPVDLDPSCHTAPVQPVNGQCGITKDSCASGDFVDITDTATDYKWQCNGKNGGTSVVCSLRKPSQPVNGVCAKNVTVPVDGTKLVDYAKANPSLFCDPGTLVLATPEFSNDKLTWECAWLNGWEPSQTCTVSCPSGYSLLNGACVKVVEQKNCSVEIKDLSCKEARGNGWWVDRSLSYTYTWKDCRFSAIYDSWTPTEKWNLVASHNSPSGDSHIVNSDGSITATRKLNNDQIGPWYWPDTHTFYVDMWGNTSSKKSFSMYGYARKCRNALPQTPKTPIKIDWNGKPFEWEKYTIYIEGPKGTPVKIGNLNNIMERWPNWECSSIPVTRDYWIAIGNCVVSDVSVTWNPWPRLYLPYHSNSWVKFKLENWTSGKIIEANYYIWNLLGEWK